MVIKIKIDCREQDLLREITNIVAMNVAFGCLEIESENLPIGDIILEDTECDVNPRLIIERKTIPDLLSSLRDGRYTEQSYRLNGITEVPNHNIIYLIEGDSMNNKFFKRIDKKTFYSVMFSLNYKKGFSVMRTQCVSETAFYICNAAMKIKDCSSSQSVETSEQPPQEKDYVHVIKRVKKENITPNNIDEIMLSQIPNVSPAIAIAIIEKFGSIKQMILLTSSNHGEEEEEKEEKTKTKKKEINLFDDIYTVNKNGSKRKISKKAVENIYKFLLK
jgi:ERCC4-type nuclease